MPSEFSVTTKQGGCVPQQRGGGQRGAVSAGWAEGAGRWGWSSQGGLLYRWAFAPSPFLSIRVLLRRSRFCSLDLDPEWGGVRPPGWALGRAGGGVPTAALPSLGLGWAPR